MDFLWHKVSESEKKKIKKEAKEIMNSFSRKLSRVSDKISEAVVEIDEGERREGSDVEVNIDRKIMFSNAPEKNNDFIIGEKGGW